MMIDCMLVSVINNTLDTCNYQNCSDADGTWEQCANNCPATGINTGYYPDGCVIDLGNSMDISSCTGTCSPCVLPTKTPLTCYLDSDNDGISDIVISSSSLRIGNLLAKVLNPTPLTPPILSEVSPQIDFAKQKLEGNIPNFSLTSFCVTNFFHVGE